MKIKFYGAAQMVTGSNYLVETESGLRFLVDCGLFQGSKADEAKNALPFPYNPAEIDFLILTHAHIDHSGRIPKLVRDGFNGTIYCSAPTRDLVEIMLYDAASIQRSDAEWENKKLQREGKEAVEPLFTEEDVNRTVDLLKPLYYHVVADLAPGVQLRLVDAGHILGSSSLELWIKEGERQHKLVFSGDLGMSEHLLIRNPETIDEADLLIMESTYGNSTHGSYQESLEEMMQIIEQTTSAGGTVVIPAFSIGRTQELIYEMNKYYEYEADRSKPLPPIYIDSPLALEATQVFARHTDVLNDEAQKLIRGGDNIFRFPNLRYIRTVDESRELNASREPKVIISASGMATAGRVRHHLKHNLWDSRNAVIFVGYQAEGTLGRLLKDGLKSVKILGSWVNVAAKIYDMPGFSAHADAPALLSWVDHFQKKPKTVVLVHGEPREMGPLAEVLHTRYGVTVEQPLPGAVLEFTGEACTTSECGLAPLPEKQKLAQDYATLKALMADLEEKEPDFDELKPEDRNALAGRLSELKQQIMDLHMILGK